MEICAYYIEICIDFPHSTFARCDAAAVVVVVPAFSIQNSFPLITFHNFLWIRSYSKSLNIFHSSLIWSFGDPCDFPICFSCAWGASICANTHHTIYLYSTRSR